MKAFRLRFGSEWKVLGRTRRSQAAQMVIPRGGKEGGPDNRHAADQWLFVVSGTGEARVKRSTTRLAPNTLLLIKAGETHEIRNTGRTPLRTLNVYAPPAYG
jgi:mannose-6-phosphate isomerase-like protein (cupin superfamily)